jgi:adenylyltransferase/sulfurtransferase
VSRVLVVGAGGLGCPVLYGLGEALSQRGASVCIADDDVVDLSNLQRQVLHRAEDVGRLKVDSAQDALERRFPRLQIETCQARVSAANVDRLVHAFDVVIDGTDQIETKFLLNDACVDHQVPLVHGGVVRLKGQLMSVVPGYACYRCLFEAPPEGEVASCQEAGILGAVAGVVGGLMAEEALRILDGKPALAGSLLIYDGRTDERRLVKVRPRRDCEICGNAPETAEVDGGEEARTS